MNAFIKILDSFFGLIYMNFSKKIIEYEMIRTIVNIMVLSFCAFALFYERSEIMVIPIFTRVVIFLMYIINVIFLFYERKQLSKVEQTNDNLQKDIETQDYLLLRNHYAGHNIKNAVQNMEWAIDGLETKLTENDTEALQLTLNNLRGTIDELKGLESINQKTAVSIQEFWSVFEKLYRNPFKQKSVKFNVIYQDQIQGLELNPKIKIKFLKMDFQQVKVLVQVYFM